MVFWLGYPSETFVIAPKYILTKYGALVRICTIRIRVFYARSDPTNIEYRNHLGDEERTISCSPPCSIVKTTKNISKERESGKNRENRKKATEKKSFKIFCL